MYKYCNLMLFKSQSPKIIQADGFLFNTCVCARTSHANTRILVRIQLTDLCGHISPEVVLPLCNGAAQTEPKQPSSDLLDKGLTVRPYPLLEVLQRDKRTARCVQWAHVPSMEPRKDGAMERCLAGAQESGQAGEAGAMHGTGTVLYKRKFANKTCLSLRVERNIQFVRISYKSVSYLDVGSFSISTLVKWQNLFWRTVTHFPLCEPQCTSLISHMPVHTPKCEALTSHSGSARVSCVSKVSWAHQNISCNRSTFGLFGSNVVSKFVAFNTPRCFSRAPFITQETAEVWLHPVVIVQVVFIHVFWIYALECFLLQWQKVGK